MARMRTSPAYTRRQARSTNWTRWCLRSNILSAGMCSNTWLTSHCSTALLKSRPHCCLNPYSLSVASLVRQYVHSSLSTTWAKRKPRECLSTADPQWRGTSSASYMRSSSQCIDSNMGREMPSLNQYQRGWKLKTIYRWLNSWASENNSFLGWGLFRHRSER